MSEDYEVGDLVWAKMKNFPPWPAKIAEPKLDVKAPKNKKAYFVFFFGTENFAWIRNEHISPHSESILNTQLSKKVSPTYQNAINALLTFCKSNKEKLMTPRKEKTLLEVKKSPETKVVNSIQKKQERKVMLSKPEKKARKRSRSLDHNIKKRDVDYKSPKKGKYGHSEYDDSLKSLNFCNTPPSNADSNHDKTRMDLQIENPNNIKKKKIHGSPTKKKIGFIGLGHMGKAIVKILLVSGHKVTLWNRTLALCEKFEQMGAKYVDTPAELVVACDIIFCCVSDPEASRSVIFQEYGILKGLQQSESMGLMKKGYVEMSSLDPETSLEISEVVERKNGRYLEAPICGTSKNAEEGNLLVLAAGESTLFFESESCFHAIGARAYYLSCEVGSAAKVSVVLNSLFGTMCGALAEAMMMFKRFDIPADKEFFMQLFREGPLRMDNLVQRGEMMLHHNLKTVITPLKHMQKDLNFCLLLGNKVSQHLPIFAAANEVYKRVRSLKYSNNDVSAVLQGLRY